jgi:SAM-dependent methyltransferase
MTEHARQEAGSSLGREPLAALEAAVWALSAAVATMREALAAPLADVLAADAERTAVLTAIGLVENGPDGLVPHRSLRPDGGSASVEAKLGSIRQALALAAGDAGDGWGEQDDAVLLHQGRASAGTGRALATKIVPALPGLAGRLDSPGARILDVGTGVAALALALARALPQVTVVGIDISERPLTLARREIAAAEDVSGRVSVRRQDVADLAEHEAFDLVWLPAPFLGEAVIEAALPRVAAATRPGGWVVVGTNPAPADPLLSAVARWRATRNGGSAYDTGRAEAALTAGGLDDLRTFPTVPGGPILVAARRGPA